MRQVWVVDDDKSIRWVFEKALSKEGLPYKIFSKADDVLDEFKKSKPQVLVSDIRMPGVLGTELLKKVNEIDSTIPVIIMTAYSDLDSAVVAFQGGAYEYLPKPFDVNQALDIIRKASSNSVKKNEISEKIQKTESIIGKAPSMQEVFRSIGRLASSNATVLINGESGTGKELIAHALHKHSSRAEAPFIAINSAAIPKDLLESELFGHEKGAFTGAQNARQGRFEQAENGTLFLDEIGDMPFELQTRLLRVMSDGGFYRVGGQNLIKTNARIITATHQDLERLVKEKKFREDLFHRLNVIKIKSPSLRERNEDIPLLAEYFLKKISKKLQVETKNFSKSTLKKLIDHEWPGNVRQLENLCHWLTVMCPSTNIEIKDLPEDFKVEKDIKPLNKWTFSLKNEIQKLLENKEVGIEKSLANQFEKTLITTTLIFTNGKKIEAAKLLGIGRNTITRKIRELEIDL